VLVGLSTTYVYVYECYFTDAGVIYALIPRGEVPYEFCAVPLVVR
jgi:hypothetical protein